jgi:hypothetical protein
MNILDMSNDKMQKMDDFENSCLDVLLRVVKHGDDVTDMAQIAIKGMATVAKNRQTQSAKMACMAHLAQSITDDPKEFRKYVEATQPEIKRLMSPAKK